MSDSKYKVTIGLEVHAELKTASKMFCDCVNNPDEENPNTNICPVCMAHPGTLPVLNKKAIENVIKVGLAIGANIANFTEWDRKNYFYPDIPKGYQISQYKHPIVSGGELAGVKITRIHLEEDTANNKHTDSASLIDFNRAGVPLMELVTEPVIHSAEDAGKFGRELQTLLRTLGVSDANMEKGEMRVELNLSVSATEKFGTKVEVKNINSFRAVEKAAKFEIERHIALLEEGRGNEIVQETRGWDENKEITFSQRTKENSEDYRYFPEPDLPKMYLHDVFDLDAMRKDLPELPWQKREKYTSLGIKSEDVEVFVTDFEVGSFFEKVSSLLNDKEMMKKASNYITTDLAGLRSTKADFKMPEVEAFVSLIKMVGENKVNSRGAKDILAILCEEGGLSAQAGNPEEIAKEKGLLQESNTDAIKEIVQKVIDANQKVAEEYKAGNENVIKFLMGQVMKESKGSANPQVATEILIELLK
ncbi:MAG: aspartyl-tRNA(Asn)/glutamyl-tRNA(Gln) amidotransferase subunit [Patescibacteria group bacterium]|nr:aspartyl-tRNA(Asn)/glutamyl-tRNA(Gln) amidotransferase subunit [Patescibacteria group bacterium]